MKFTTRAVLLSSAAVAVLLARGDAVCANTLR